MNPREREELARFLGQLTEVRLTDRDPEADTMIREAALRQPDAAYLLVQRAMLMEQALNAAKARIEALQRNDQVEPSAADGGFLRGPNPWAPPATPGPAANQVPGAAAYRMPGGMMAPAAGPTMSGGGGSFLGNVATTAAGVVAGSFLFQGLEGLLGHHPQGGSLWGEAGSEQLSEQTVINNYYGTAPEAVDDSRLEPDGGAFFASDVDDGYTEGGPDDGDWI